MKTFALFLCLIATTADAAPLYLACEGKYYPGRHPEEAEQTSKSVIIVEKNLWFNGGVFGLPSFIYADGEDSLAFSGGRISGNLNRITGRIEVEVEVGKNYTTVFEGVCHKTEKLF